MELDIGLFCEGTTLLPIVSPRTTKHEDHVTVDEYAAPPGDLGSTLRRALTERCPALWDEGESRASIIIYLPAYYYAVSPVDSIHWDDVLPGLGVDTEQRWRQKMGGVCSTPKADPAHVFMPEDNNPFIVQVKIWPKLLGRGSARGGMMLELHVEEAALTAFAEALEL